MHQKYMLVNITWLFLQVYHKNNLDQHMTILFGAKYNPQLKISSIFLINLHAKSYQTC